MPRKGQGLRERGDWGGGISSPPLFITANKILEKFEIHQCNAGRVCSCPSFRLNALTISLMKIKVSLCRFCT